ncbi:hypothetical protein Dda3937_04533 [Dickeya dadantii 3937]|uniref:Uncharacterized protein n=1 Tax=Dickeya dadantii (strain 3937) TaxID=198628 RepID=E0SJE9_DICD3|nr:hypothetical protein Dda3937_04533 [Dickeya dadantii 3937]
MKKCHGLQRWGRSFVSMTMMSRIAFLIRSRQIIFSIRRGRCSSGATAHAGFSIFTARKSSSSGLANRNQQSVFCFTSILADDIVVSCVGYGRKS